MPDLKYRALLFHPEGDYVTDFRSTTKQDVWERIADMGSRWIFYPIPFVATDKTIVDVPDGLEHLKGKRIKTVQNYLKNYWKHEAEFICASLNKGAPLEVIYPNPNSLKPEHNDT